MGNLRIPFRENKQRLQKCLGFIWEKLDDISFEEAIQNPIDQKKKICQPCLEKTIQCKGGFPVMAEITRILAANIRRQFFFVITTAVSTRCLVQNFQLICYSQRVNATSQYNDGGSSTCSKWLNDRIVAVVKHFWLLV